MSDEKFEMLIKFLAILFCTPFGWMGMIFFTLMVSAILSGGLQ